MAARAAPLSSTAWASQPCCSRVLRLSSTRLAKGAGLLVHWQQQRSGILAAAVVGPDSAASTTSQQLLDSGSISTVLTNGSSSSSDGGGGYSVYELVGQAPWQRPYPYIDAAFPGLEKVHEDPPVYIAHNFLSDADCQLLRSSAQAGQLPHLDYDNSVLLDTHRLWPLLLVVATGAGFDCWQALAAGGGADASRALSLSHLAVDSLAAAAGPALLKWAVGVGGLVGLALAAANWMVGGKVFTGTKWTCASLDPHHPTAPVLSRFLSRTCGLLGLPATRLEPPTVTRYRVGQYQRIHFDARPDGDPAGLKKFLEAGGQRLVQVVVYLNTLTPDQGGGTKFWNPLLAGLTVQPKQGDALVFFPAFADGRFDERMAHSGQPVLSGEKWIINTWACARPVPAAVRHLLVHDCEASAVHQQ